MQLKPALGFLEVYSENFFDDGGAALAVLAEGRTKAQASVAAFQRIEPVRPISVGCIHLGGLAELPNIVINDQGRRVRPEVCAVYAHVLMPLGQVPSLIEWDTDLPALDVLLGKASLGAMSWAY